jgi:hypothetical protein
MTAQENLDHYEICIVNQMTSTIQHRFQVYQNGSCAQNYIHSFFSVLVLCTQVNMMFVMLL